MFQRLEQIVRGRTSRFIKSHGFFREHWYPRYQFQMNPRQLVFLTDMLESVADVEGEVLEIGCAHGLTTTFLYEYMVESGIEKPYTCIDTFSGFTENDMAVEFQERANRHDWIAGMFKDNHPQWFKEALHKRSIDDVRVVCADICAVKADALPPKIAFCLLDVDLYQPIKRGLAKIYPRLSPGGIIVVDDCWSNPKEREGSVAEAYDGALQAYREFVTEHDLPCELVEGKFGIIRKPA